MSGSGSGSSVSPGGTSTGEPIACELLVAHTFLDSPNPEVVSSINVGDVLQVNLRRVDVMPPRYSLEVVAVDGRIAGTANPPNLPRFIECINTGYSYVAGVEAKQEGLVRIALRPAAKQGR